MAPPPSISSWFQDTGEFLDIFTSQMGAHSIVEIEAFHGLLEEERLSLHEFETYTEGYEQMARYMEFYNRTRMHLSLEFITPEECCRAT